MLALRIIRFTGFFAAWLTVPGMVQKGGAQQGGNAPLPDIRALMLEVQEHQKQVEKVRENYTYSSQQTTQDIDSNGQVKKTETQEAEDFFVNGHLIERTVKKDGKTLDDHEQQKETERVTKLVEKAEKTPPDQSLEGQGISISRAGRGCVKEAAGDDVD